MLEITEITIFSVDKDDEQIWAIEGEIVFDEELQISFWANYYLDEDEFEQFEMDLEDSEYDKKLLKKKIVQACKNFKDDDMI